VRKNCSSDQEKLLNFEAEGGKFEITRHSMLRLDATTKKRSDGKLFKFKKFSIKQAFFINDISSSQVKAHKQKKN
jgi:hypothetical protein